MELGPRDPSDFNQYYWLNNIIDWSDKGTWHSVALCRAWQDSEITPGMTHPALGQVKSAGDTAMLLPILYLIQHESTQSTCMTLLWPCNCYKGWEKKYKSRLKDWDYLFWTWTASKVQKTEDAFKEEIKLDLKAAILCWLY